MDNAKQFEGYKYNPVCNRIIGHVIHEQQRRDGKARSTDVRLGYVRKRLLNSLFSTEITRLSIYTE